ncbi:uncharacterized protein [Watersipora subatra]|uniref:uncharacterized protein n=1 Tax=Watersipora subatra TaxID=2589382 RepID=UPI00355B0442
MGKSTQLKDLDLLGVTVTLKLPDGKTIPATLHQHDQMAKIYSLASEECGERQSLIRIKYSGKVLQQHQSVSYLGLMSGMVLKTEVITVRTLDLTIKLERDDNEGEVMTLQCYNTDTPQQLLQQLEERECRNCQIYLGSKKLPSEQMLCDLKIGNNSTLTARLQTKSVKNPTSQPPSAQESLPDIMPTFTADGKLVEVVFSFDTTGSMSSVLTQVRSSVRDIVDRLVRDIPNIRVGLMVHGDYDHYANYVVKSHELCNDAESLKRFAMDVSATGGGFTIPEAYELVLKKAQEMDWSENSAKALVVIGDSAPHPPSFTDQNIYWHTELDILSALGIKVYGVQARSDRAVTSFYKELADRTNGAYVTFSNISLIKDMFLAVCYNEASEQHLGEFRSELEEGGQLTAQQEQIFSQLQEQQEAVKEDKAAEIIDLQIAFDPRQSKNYTSASWFDKALDHGTPQYTYKPETDKWAPCAISKNVLSLPSTTPAGRIVPSTSNVRTNKKPKTRKPTLIFNCFASSR